MPEKPSALGSVWHLWIRMAFLETAATSDCSEVPSATPPMKHVTEGLDTILLVWLRLLAAWMCQGSQSRATCAPSPLSRGTSSA